MKHLAQASSNSLQWPNRMHILSSRQRNMTNHTYNNNFGHCEEMYLDMKRNLYPFYHHVFINCSDFIVLYIVVYDLHLRVNVCVCLSTI